MLMLLKLPYNSEEGRAAAGRVMRIIQQTAIDESVNLGREKGNFANFRFSKWRHIHPTMRNASLTNVAPTGSTSILLNVSSGVEPYYALSYHHSTTMDFDAMTNPCRLLTAALKELGLWNPETEEQLSKTGTLENIQGIPDESRKVFVTALEISSEDHILMQSVVQRYCCNAISKTVNFPEHATEHDIRTGFIQAWQAKCKGLTVFRDKSLGRQVLEVSGRTCLDGSCDC
jgi:ribonucleoside-diphosphate reductase alpha chain